MTTSRSESLLEALKQLYAAHKEDLPYHGWHHIDFVTSKCVEFSDDIQLDAKTCELLKAAALTHDLNYITNDDGAQLRTQYLAQNGFNKSEIDRIEKIIDEAHMSKRHEDISDEAKVLSDADTLFKIVPISHLIFTPYYFAENGVDIKHLAEKIVSTQIPLLRKGVYFYNSEVSKKYLKWAEVNLALWEQIYASLEDKDVMKLMELSQK